MDFRGQPEILNAEDYGLSGTEPVINQECMLVHEKSGHYVKLSGTAIIDNITASNSLFEAVFLYNGKLHFPFPIIQKASGRMRTRANKNYVASDCARRENVPRHILCSIQINPSEHFLS